MSKYSLSTRNPWNFYNVVDGFFGDSSDAFRSISRDSFKVDVKDQDGAYIVEAEVPGFTKEEIDLSLMKGVLTIAVKKEEEQSEEEPNYVHRERRVRSMARRLYLGEVDEEKISAKLDNGILSISVPKKAAQIKRSIEIE
ncbi:MAG: Hsp20/alpha crystallin family protein [Tissierellia bacterium]|nr:Hsp20/alpha crystallin family protein [Tissierellia bacterium]